MSAKSEVQRDPAGFSKISKKKKVRPSVKSPFLQAGSAHTNEDAAKTAEDLVDLLRLLIAWLDDCGSSDEGSFKPLNMARLQTASDSWSSSDTWSGNGADVVRLVTDVMGLSSVKIISMKIEALKKLRKGLIDIGLESTAVRSSTINDVEAILWRLCYVLQSGGSDYQILLKRKEPSFSNDQKSSRRGNNISNTGPRFDDVKSGAGNETRKKRKLNVCGVKLEWKMDIVCLRAAHPFAFATSEAKSVLLGSGTLGPFDSLAQELGVNILDEMGRATENFLSAEEGSATTGGSLLSRIDLVGSDTAIWNGGARVCIAPKPRSCICSSAEHHRGIDHMVLRVVVSEFNRTKLRLTQRNINSETLDALGGAILQCVRSVQSNGGVLVFFPSYSLLEKWRIRSKENGCLLAFERGQITTVGSVRKIKLFIEEQNSSGDDFTQTLNAYKAQAEKCSLSEEGDGAVLLAVQRGRASEGADFRDFAARAVVVIGVPFPSLSTETRMIIAHREAVAGKGAGDLWYEAEAYRQVSQAAGRLIRHQNDFGALFLIDERYKKPSSILPQWIVQNTSLATSNLFQKVSCFFKDRQENSPPQNLNLRLPFGRTHGGGNISRISAKEDCASFKKTQQGAPCDLDF